MRKIALALIITLSTTLAHADWTQSSFKEPAIGCLTIGGGAYIMGMDATMAGVGCVLGAVVGMAVEGYYVDKVSGRYEEEIRILKTQVDEILLNSAVNNSQGVFDRHGLTLKETVIPAQEMPDGSFQLQTIRLKPSLPGQGMILGD